MDTSKKNRKKKQTINTDPKIFIKEKYLQLVDLIREENPNIPSQWLSGSDELIELVSSKLPVEECVGLWFLSIDALKFILEKDDPLGEWDIEVEKDKNKIVFDWYFLFRLAKEQNYKEIKKLIESDGKLIVALGYLSIFIISLFKLHLLLEDNPNPRDSLYIYYGNELEQDPKSKVYLENAIQTLCRYIAYNFKGKEDRDDKIKPSHTYELWSAISKLFKENLVDNLIMAAEGDEKLKNIANSVKFDLIDEYRKYDKGRNDYGDENDQYIENLIYSEEFSNASELQEAEVLPNLQSMKNWIDKVPDPIDREILNYKYFNKLPLREIGDKVEIKVEGIGTLRNYVEQNKLPLTII